MKRRIVPLLAVLVLGASVQGQEAAKITEILDSPQLTAGQAAYLAASWLDSSNETLDYSQAAELAAGRGLLKEDAAAGDSIRLDELAGLCMKAWEIPGGLLYRMTKADRYAFKELKALGYLAATDDPSFPVTGFRGLNIMFKCMEYHTPALSHEASTDIGRGY